MLQKDIYLNGGGVIKDHTHLVLVEKEDISKADVYGYGSNFGKITPNTVTFYDSFYKQNKALTISQLWTETRTEPTTKIQFNSRDAYTTLYIARGNSKDVKQIALSGSTSEFDVDLALFSSADLNKETPVWIANTPPPMVRRPERSRWPWSDWLARIATFTKRWHDVKQKLCIIWRK